MEKETIVQFVCFETAGDSTEFIAQWDQYTKEMNDKQELTLQQEIGSKKKSRYLSQHRCHDDEFKFIFKKERRSAHFPEVEMRVRQLGGYTALQLQCKHDSRDDESKIFVFITNPQVSLDECRQLSDYRFLNIYKAYFESSTYEYILEFFVDNSHTEELLTQVKSQIRYFELGVYKECLVQVV